MAVRVGINGFGRIGRNFFKAAKQRGADIDFVAANDPFGSKELMAHLLRHDTVQGIWDVDIEVADEGIKVDGDTIKILAERDPANLPWADLGVDCVIESTGVFSSEGTGQRPPHGRRAARHRDASPPPAPTPPSSSA